MNLTTTSTSVDWHYLDSLNEIDRRNSEGKERIKSRIKLVDALECDLQAYSSYTREETTGVTADYTCQVTNPSTPTHDVTLSSVCISLGY